MRYYRLLILFFFSQSLHADGGFLFGDQSIAPGTSKSWMQPVASTYIPMTILHGKYPGPVLTLTAGIHGDEYPGIFTLQRLKDEISPETLTAH